MMLQKNSNPWTRLKYMYVLPLAAITVAAFAQPEISQTIGEITNGKNNHFVLEKNKNDEKVLPETEISVFSSIAIAAIDPQVSIYEGEEIYDLTDLIPQFPGGQSALLKFIAENTIYPVYALENDIQGTVQCYLIIEKDGSVSQVEVIRPAHPLLDAESIRVLKTLPKFRPAKIGEVPVRVRSLARVRFELERSH